jgi:hypothetical protein
MNVQELVDAPTVGDVLPNGATVLDSVITQMEAYGEGTYRHGYVLALRGREFVTWRLGMYPSGATETMSGHYFGALLPAVKDFAERVGGAR